MSQPQGKAEQWGLGNREQTLSPPSLALGQQEEISVFSWAHSPPLPRTSVLLGGYRAPVLCFGLKCTPEEHLPTQTEMKGVMVVAVLVSSQTRGKVQLTLQMSYSGATAWGHSPTAI